MDVCKPSGQHLPSDLPQQQHSGQLTCELQAVSNKTVLTLGRSEGWDGTHADAARLLHWRCSDPKEGAGALG